MPPAEPPCWSLARFRPTGLGPTSFPLAPSLPRGGSKPLSGLDSSAVSCGPALGLRAGAPGGHGMLPEAATHTPWPASLRRALSGVWRLCFLLPDPLRRCPSRPCGPKASSKACAPRPARGLLDLEGSPALHGLWEKPESGSPSRGSGWGPRGTLRGTPPGPASPADRSPRSHGWPRGPVALGPDDCAQRELSRKGARRRLLGRQGAWGQRPGSATSLSSPSTLTPANPHQCSEFRGGVPHRSLWAPSSAVGSRRADA